MNGSTETDVEGRIWVETACIKNGKHFNLAYDFGKSVDI